MVVVAMAAAPPPPTPAWPASASATADAGGEGGGGDGGGEGGGEGSGEGNVEGGGGDKARRRRSLIIATCERQQANNDASCRVVPANGVTRLLQACTQYNPSALHTSDYASAQCLQPHTQVVQHSSSSASRRYDMLAATCMHEGEI